jgi:hypothetical protein
MAKRSTMLPGRENGGPTTKRTTRACRAEPRGRCCGEVLQPADKEQVRYRSTVSQVWEYLDRAYMRQDTFLHDLIKPVHAFKELGEQNYRGLEEYLDLLLRTIYITEDGGMLPLFCTRTTCGPCTRSGRMGGTRPSGRPMQGDLTPWTSRRSSSDTSGTGIM